jgi:hypothetical protein
VDGGARADHKPGKKLLGGKSSNETTDVDLASWR